MKEEAIAIKKEARINNVGLFIITNYNNIGKLVPFLNKQNTLKQLSSC
jgi:hypothetical protein